MSRLLPTHLRTGRVTPVTVDKSEPVRTLASVPDVTQGTRRPKLPEAATLLTDVR